MPVVRMPDGTDVQFPEDMKPDQIKGLISSKFPNDVASHLEDTASAIRSGMSWSDVASAAVKNAPSSAGQFIESMVQPFVHPVQTAEDVGRVALGAAEKNQILQMLRPIAEKHGIKIPQESTKYADAVGQFFKERYGGIDNIKQTIAKDPVGVLADIATVLTGGETALARTPGMVGKAAQVAGTVGRSIDPLSAVGKIAKGAGTVGAEITGLSTGAGGEAIKTAAKSGAEGGEAGKAFLSNLTGSVPADQVVDEAKKAVLQLRLDRGQEYRSAMAKMGGNDKVLDFNKIDKAVNDVAKVKTFKGVPISTKTDSIRQELMKEVEDWKELDPKQYHTAEGLDALKQKLGEIRDATQFGTPDRKVADDVYRSVRGTIIDEAPEYAKIMNGYEQASSLIQEMEKTLSLKPEAQLDTQLRKLQSVLRNNVSTNYGRREELVKFLQRAGAPNLINKLAGQALSSVAPRGLGRISALGDIMGAGGALAAHNPAVAASFVAGLGASSPLLVGSAAYGAGVASRFGKGIGRSAFQIGRQEDQ